VKKTILISALALFFAVSLLPLGAIFFDSLYADGTFSFESIRNLFHAKRQIDLFVRTLTIGLGTAACALLIGVPLGFLLVKTDIRLRRYLKLLYLMPLVIPPHASVAAWIAFCGAEGWLNQFYKAVFSSETPLFLIYGMDGCILILTLSYFPVITALTGAGLHSLDRRHEDAGRLCGSSFSIFTRITLPLIAPYLIAGFIVVAILATLNYGVPSLLRVNTYPVEILTWFSAFYDAKAAVALSAPLSAFMFSLLFLLAYSIKAKPLFTIGSHAKPGRLIESGRWRFVGTGYAVSVVFISAFAPILLLLLKAASWAAYKTAFITAYKQIGLSLVFSGAAACLCALPSFFIAYFIEKILSRGKMIFYFIFLIPLATPGAVMGIGLIYVWNRPLTDALYQSPLMIILAYIARFSPFVIICVYANLRQIHKNMETAAAMLHSSWLNTVFKINLPLCLPGLATGLALMFIFSMADLSTALLIVPPGMTTLSIRIYTLMHYGAGSLTACLCLFLILATLVPIAGLMYFFQIKSQKGGLL